MTLITIKVGTLLTLSLAILFINIGSGISQQSPLGRDLETYIAEVEGREFWYGLSGSPKRFGYLKSVIHRKMFGDQEFIIIETVSAVALSDDDGATTKKSASSIYFNAATGKPTKCIFEVSGSQGANSKIKLAIRKGNEWDISETGKTRSAKKISHINFGLRDYLSLELWTRSVQKIGAKGSESHLDCETLEFSVSSYELLKTKRMNIGGVEMDVKVLKSLKTDDPDFIEAEVEVLNSGTIYAIHSKGSSVLRMPKSMAINRMP
jgi:hypothetical protein